MIDEIPHDSMLALLLRQAGRPRSILIHSSVITDGDNTAADGRVAPTPDTSIRHIRPSCEWSINRSIVASRLPQLPHSDELGQTLQLSDVQMVPPPGELLRNITSCSFCRQCISYRNVHLFSVSLVSPVKHTAYFQLLELITAEFWPISNSWKGEKSNARYGAVAT